MGNIKNHARKNKRLANNWRQIIRMRKLSNTKPQKKDALSSNLENAQNKNNRTVGAGMVNLGNSCYLNSTLQALFNIHAFAEWLGKKWNHDCDPETDHQNSCLVCALAHVMQSVQSSFGAIRPIQVHSKLNEISPMFKEGEQNDAHEFLKSILESVTTILTSLRANEETRDEDMRDEEIWDEEMRNEEMRDEAEEMRDEEVQDKIIQDDVSKIFSGRMRSSVKCMTCKTETEKLDDFKELLLDIENASSVTRAMKIYFNIETIEEFYCKTCGKNVQATRKFSVEKAPVALCIMLNRFENKLKKNENFVKVPPEFNLSKYTTSNTSTPIKYRLKSIISHIGTLESGHYTTLVCKNGSQNIKHYEFDDDHVKKVPLNDVTTANAYILLYEMIPTGTGASTTANTKDDQLRKLNPLDKAVDDMNNDFSETERESQHHNVSGREQITSEKESVPSLKSVEHDHNYIKRPENEVLTGRRIVDIKFLVKQIKNLDKDSMDCDSHDMEFIKETKMGLRSIFTFECTNCGQSKRVESSSKNEECMNINEAATLGITSVGLGFYHLEEVLAHMDVPCMSSSTFSKENKKLQKRWWEVAKKETDLALNEEIELAKSINSVDSSGNANILGIIDGSWAKRCYGKGFSSLSGFACIIGMRKKKVLYFDTKNKYCHVCKMSYAKTCPPNKHECNINFEGPSTGMESEIIVEGFQSCERKGARFHQFVGDGDANTFKVLRDLQIYKDPDTIPDKHECENHLFRNYRSGMGELNTATKYKPASREHVTASKGDDICKGVRIAAKHWRESNINEVEKLENLERDCLNAPYHYYGDHTNCQEYFCKKSTSSEDLNTINLLKADGIWDAIINITNTSFACNAKSLLKGYNTNAAEELNNVIAKNTGGKRINYVLAGSYSGRCATSVVQFNTNGHAGSTIHKLKNENLGKLLLKIENQRKAKLLRNASRRLLKPRTKIFKAKTRGKTKGNAKSKKFYGPDSERIDMPEHLLEVAKRAELARLDADRINRETILIQTYGQRYCPRWFEVRKKLVNATYFHRIVNAISPKSYKNLLDEMLYSPKDVGRTAEVLHHRLYEKEALNAFSRSYKDYKLEKTGIFIDKEISFLGASPLRLYGDDHIVLVKCPLEPFKKKKTVNEALELNLLPYWKKNKNGIVSINLKSSWHIEIQGLLHVTDRKFAFLVVWLGENEVKIEPVLRDDNFWAHEMETKLRFFYNEAMIKEIVNPRNGREMELREYDAEKKIFI